MEPIREDDALYLAALLMLGEPFCHEAWMSTRDVLIAQGKHPSTDFISIRKQFVDGDADAYFVTIKGKEALADFNKEK